MSHQVNSPFINPSLLGLTSTSSTRPLTQQALLEMYMLTLSTEMTTEATKKSSHTKKALLIEGEKDLSTEEIQANLFALGSKTTSPTTQKGLTPQEMRDALAACASFFTDLQSFIAQMHVNEGNSQVALGDALIKNMQNVINQTNQEIAQQAAEEAKMKTISTILQIFGFVAAIVLMCIPGCEAMGASMLFMAIMNTSGGTTAIANGITSLLEKNQHVNDQDAKVIGDVLASAIVASIALLISLAPSILEATVGMTMNIGATAASMGITVGSDAATDTAEITVEQVDSVLEEEAAEASQIGTGSASVIGKARELLGKFAELCAKFKDSILVSTSFVQNMQQLGGFTNIADAIIQDHYGNNPQKKKQLEEETMILSIVLSVVTSLLSGFSAAGITTTPALSKLYNSITETLEKVFPQGLNALKFFSGQLKTTVQPLTNVAQSAAQIANGYYGIQEGNSIAKMAGLTALYKALETVLTSNSDEEDISTKAFEAQEKSAISDQQGIVQAIESQSSAWTQALLAAV